MWALGTYHSHKWSPLVTPECGPGALLPLPLQKERTTNLSSARELLQRCQGTLTLELTRSREEIQFQKEEECVETQRAVPGEPWAHRKREATDKWDSFTSLDVGAAISGSKVCLGGNFPVHTRAFCGYLFMAERRLWVKTEQRMARKRITKRACQG